MTKKQFDAIVKNAVHYGNLYRKEMEKLEDWDGNEIRQFIADYYTQHFISTGYLKGKRKRDYKKEITNKTKKH